MVAVLIAMTLGLWAIYNNRLVAPKNKWLFVLMGYLLFSAWQSPQVPVIVFGKDIANFWVWKPLFMTFVFFLMYCSMSIKYRTEIMKVIMWCGFITAIHCIGQALGYHQWFVLRHVGNIKFLSQPYVTGTLGHPTLVAPLIVLSIPIAIYFKRYFIAVVMVAGVIMIDSQIAQGAVALSLLFLLALKGKKHLMASIIVLVVLSAALAIGYHNNAKVRAFTVDSGRFSRWTQIVKDLKKPVVAAKIEGRIEKKAFPYTGKGPGSFRFFSNLPANRWGHTWHEAHNEYLEVLSDVGLIGIIFFILAFIGFIDSVKPIRVNKYLLSSFVSIAVCAGGTFIWHLGTYMYYTIVIMGLLKGGEESCQP